MMLRGLDTLLWEVGGCLLICLAAAIGVTFSPLARRQKVACLLGILVACPALIWYGVPVLEHARAYRAFRLEVRLNAQPVMLPVNALGDCATGDWSEYKLFDVKEHAVGRLHLEVEKAEGDVVTIHSAGTDLKGKPVAGSQSFSRSKGPSCEEFYPLTGLLEVNLHENIGSNQHQSYPGLTALDSQPIGWYQQYYSPGPNATAWKDVEYLRIWAWNGEREQVVVWMTPEVKCGGLVSLSYCNSHKGRLEVMGYGTREKNLWQRARQE